MAQMTNDTPVQRRWNGFVDSGPKPKSFTWTKVREDAARLTAEGRLTIAEITARLNISTASLSRWRADAEFRARVEEYRRSYQRDCLERGIGSRYERLRRMNRDWRSLQRIQDERAVDPQFADIPGGKTGNITHDIKGVGVGKDAQVVDIYEVDTGLLGELRALEKAAAEELGQRIEKHSLDVTAIKTVEDIPDELLEVVIGAALAARDEDGHTIEAVAEIGDGE